MDVAGEGSGKKRKRRQDRRPARRRPARCRKLSSVTQLIQRLRYVVFPSPDTQSTKQEVLHQTRTYIQELESTLASLLKMRGLFQKKESGSCSLEEIKEEYMQICCSGDQGGALASSSSMTSEGDSLFSFLQPDFELGVNDALEELHIDSPQTPESISSPDVIEFERYLSFYKQTVDMLTESRLVSPDQITQPAVSKAIANIWKDLSQEESITLYQCGHPQAQSTPCSFTLQSDFSCTNGGPRDNSAGSQEATSSFLSSTPEEIIIEDALDVAASFLDGSANQTTSSPRSSSHESPPLQSPEGDLCLYQQVYGFLRSKHCPYSQPSSLQYDYEAMLLRCDETLDDDDL